MKFKEYEEGDECVKDSFQTKKGLWSFAIMMIGSLLSSTGTQMTQFALIAWVYEETGSALSAGILATASYGSVIIASIFAGAFVDKFSRKRLIILTDIISALATAVLLTMHSMNVLSAIVLIVYGMVRGVVGSVQFPAYLSSITMMVPPDQRSRANGMYQTAFSLSTTISPALAGTLLGFMNIEKIFLIDILTFLIIIGTLLFIKIPESVRTPEESQGSILSDTVEGFRYLFARASLLGFVLVLTFFNIAFGAYEGLYRPMVLEFTDNNVKIAGWALMGYGIGNVVSGVFMTIWKGPKNRVPLTLIAWALCGFFGFMVGGFGRTLPVWIISGFLQGIFNNVAVVLTVGIWQSKVETSFQGRVFGIMKLVAQVTIPIAVFVMTFISDKIAVPLFEQDRALSDLFGGVLGEGPGAGMSFVLILSGLLFGVISPLIMFLIPALRNADKTEEPPVEATVTAANG